jgi:flagellar biosynthesis protein FlhG
LALKEDADILILDLGAGTHQSILDFFLLSGQGIVVSAPAVTAVLNAYIFLKNTVFRLLYSTCAKGTNAWDFLEQARKGGAGPRNLYLPKLLPEMKKRDKVFYEKFRNHLGRLHPRLVMNLIDDPKDANVAMKIRRSCEEYLGLEIEHLGIIYRDSIQETALSSRLPVVLYKPQALISQAIYRIADKILSSSEEASPLDPKEIEESFQEAELEAELDFENRMEYVEELLHSGALSQGDLVETVKSQQFEISKLKKENNFLKVKLTRAIEMGYKP